MKDSMVGSKWNTSGTERHQSWWTMIEHHKHEDGDYRFVTMVFKRTTREWSDSELMLNDETTTNMKLDRIFGKRQ